MDVDVSKLKIAKREVARTIQRPIFDGAVDIIIPFHGAYDRVTRLLESIYRFTYSNRCHICVVDDCSPNPTYIDNLTEIKTLTCLRTKEQRGFGGALEAGIKKTNNSWILCIHSDCVVEEIGWLSQLGESMLRLKDQGVKMIAPLTNNPLGGDPRQKGLKDQRGDDIILEDTHLSMYCFLIHRELFKRVGFIKNYPLGWYEDEEFAYRMRKFGFKQGISVKSWIYHEGEATIKELCRRDPTALNKIQGNYDLALNDIAQSLKK